MANLLIRPILFINILLQFFFYKEENANKF